MTAETWIDLLTRQAEESFDLKLKHAQERAANLRSRGKTERAKTYEDYVAALVRERRRLFR